MTQHVISASVNARGALQLPAKVRHLLHLQRKGGLVGFVIQENRIMLTKVAIVPEPTLSEEEFALLARSSKQGRGRRTFRTKDAALEYLWSL